MKKTNWLSLMLALVMCLFLLPAGAQAETISEKVTIGFAPDAELPDHDEIFAAYVEREMYRPIYGDISIFGTRGRDQLNETAQKLYDHLVPGIKEIAAGNRASSQFVIDDLSAIGINLGYSAEDLGVDSLVVNNAIPQDAVNAFSAAVERDLLHNQMLVDALLSDCPYDLYWYDKAYADNTNNEYAFMFSMSLIYQDDQLVPCDVILSFRVASAYGNVYTLDTTKTGAASAAVTIAQEIVANYDSLSDENKLIAYRNEICDLVTYNHDAASDAYTGGYGDPWQLIYVFDGDTSTNIVCEGYSKAFQYLCDISQFDGDVYCYSVSGDMAGGTGAGPHMWNIVQKDGGNYLVDVTNCDQGSIGYPDKLFMISDPTSGTWDSSYVINVGDTPITYTYDAETTSLWDENVLELKAATHTHAWNDAIYAWNADYTACTAQRACAGCDVTETASAAVTSAVTATATCVAEGEITYKAAFAENWAAEQTASVITDVDAANHASAEFTYEANAGDSTKHDKKHACCGVLAETADHIGGTATCIDAAVCEMCHSSYGEAIGHTYGEAVFTWSEDGTSASASVVCSICDETVDGHTLTETAVVTVKESSDGNCQTACTVTYEAAVELNGVTCTDEKTVEGDYGAHTMKLTEGSDSTCLTTGNSAYYTCEICGAFFSDEAGEQQIEKDSWVLPLAAHQLTFTDAVEATCAKPGNSAYYTCSVCSQYFNDADGKNAIEKDNWVLSATGEHVYATETERKDATCTEDGYVIMACGCGATETTTLPATGHTPDDAKRENEKPATCKETGSYDEVVRCVKCNEIISSTSKVIEKLDHTPGDAVKEKEVAANCTTKGSYDSVVYCTVCDAEVSRETITVDALGHDYKAVVTAPTCTEKGYTTYTCSVCGDSYTADEVAALDHTTGDTVKENEVAASCGTDGSYDSVVYCTVCDAEISRETVTVPATGEHVYATEKERKDATCTEDGYVIMACGCGETQKTTLSATGHIPGEAKRENEKPATCKETGSYDEVVRCSICNEIISSTPKIIEKLDHTAGETVIENRVEPTCKQEGSYDEVVYCTECEAEISREVRSIAKLDTHTDDDQNNVCDVCGKQLGSNSVEVEDTEGGKVDVSVSEPETGDEVIITITPEADQEVAEVIVTDEQGNPVAVIKMANGQYSFKQPSGKVTVKVVFAEAETVLYTATITSGRGSGSYAEGETVSISADAPADGMQFTGWTGAEGLTFTSGSVSTAQAAFTMPARNVMLSASYEAIADVKYTITFQANGGTGTMDPLRVPAGQPISLPACGYTAPEGLQFIGWALSEDGAIIASPTMFEKDTTLYAVWVSAPVEEAKPAEPPKTGDNACIGLWMLLMLLSAAGMAAIAINRKSKTE